jgi:hypothetical protein
MLVDLGFGQHLTAGNSANMIKHSCSYFGDRRFAIQNVPRRKIQIARHAPEHIIV